MNCMTQTKEVLLKKLQDEIKGIQNAPALLIPNMDNGHEIQVKLSAVQPDCCVPDNAHLMQSSHSTQAWCRSKTNAFC